MSVLVPEEIVMEIVLRFPPKSLIRFKCVCKPWCSLFSSSSFMAKILLPDRDGDDDNHLFVKYYDNNVMHYKLSPISHEHDKSRNLLLPPCPEGVDGGVPYYIGILGSCNGLICLHYSSGYNDDYQIDIALWSLATGDVKFLPPPPPTLESDFGLGYDDVSQDYKLIRITREKGRRGIGESEIYSFKSDSWRGILWDDLLDTLRLSTIDLASMNGIVWWSAYQDLDHHIEWDWVLWFRLRDESFRAFMRPPNRFHGKPYHKDKLLPLNDRLGMVVYDMGYDLVERSFHVWVLLEFGIEDSWTPLFTLGPLVGGIEEPLWFWNNGKMIMLNSDQQFFLCDPFGQEIKLVQMDALPNPIWSGTQIVSIPAKIVAKASI